MFIIAAIAVSGAIGMFWDRDAGAEQLAGTSKFPAVTEPRHYRVALQPAKGASPVLTAAQRYGKTETSKWFRGALAWDTSPVDLSFLNRDDRPAGRHGFVKADGDHFVFQDGTPVRFWGGNLAAAALFSTPRQNVATQAHRMAQLGYNLMRIHHHDSGWVNPNIFDRQFKDSRHLNAKSLDALDWWIKCLKDEGIYVWIDAHVGRLLMPNDPVGSAQRKSKSRAMISRDSATTTKTFKS